MQKILNLESSNSMQFSAKEYGISKNDSIREIFAALKKEKIARIFAERANKQKEHLLTAICHDLRTPLNAILGWTQIAQNSTGRIHPKDALSRIEEQARMQARLIDDILDLAKSTNGTLRSDLVPLDLNEVVKNALEPFSSLFSAKGIRTEFNHGTEANLVMGDAMQLRRVVWNLLSNALKFTPKEGKVTVSVKRDGKYVRLSVIDTGCGVTKEFLPRIFKRFEQDLETSLESKAGAGLGLEIVHRLMEAHGGTVKAESPGKGQGTTFTISLSILNAPAGTAGVK